MILGHAADARRGQTPRILSSHADVVVYVVRWDNTARGAVMEGLKELRTIKGPGGRSGPDDAQRGQGVALCL